MWICCYVCLWMVQLLHQPAMLVLLGLLQKVVQLLHQPAMLVMLAFASVQLWTFLSGNWLCRGWSWLLERRLRAARAAERPLGRISFSREILSCRKRSKGDSGGVQSSSRGDGDDVPCD